MSISRVSSVVLFLFLLVCAASLGVAGPKPDLEDLEKKVDALEQKVAEHQAAIEALLEKGFGDLSQQIQALETKVASATRDPEELEQEASTKLAEINKLVADGDFEGAKAQLAGFQKKYGRTAAARRSRSLQQELAVIGKSSPENLGIEKWYRGKDVDLDDGKATLLVFWEVWCPHCKREVPKIEQTWNKYKDQGLQVIGLTKLSRGTTEDKVIEFLDTNKVSYPIAKENGEATSYFGVSGIPAAAVVKEGKVVWRGHPARLSDSMLESWL